ncbi:MAG: radical SAM protein [Prevotella sp.]|nr:radical SAM protein [Prevotella sp.]
MPLSKKEILVRKNGCNINGGLTPSLDPSVNIYVKVTDHCNATCPFCCREMDDWHIGKAMSETEQKAKTGARCMDENHFDVDKLFKAIEDILRSKIKVNRVCVTGGEPSMALDIVNHILKNFDIPPFNRIHLQLNTNGLSNNAQELMHNPRWDTISVSMHHYNPTMLAEIYGLSHKVYKEIHNTCMPSFNGVNRCVLNLSCNLIKGYVDSPAEVQKMMDFAISQQIYVIGFVGLMPSNSFCRTHYVDYRSLDMESIPDIIKTKTKENGIHCSCSNFLYRNESGMLDVYMRCNYEPNYCASSLVYDGHFLRQGFHTDNIIF